jgi:VPDSG-CTERM motif
LVYNGLYIREAGSSGFGPLIAKGAIVHHREQTTTNQKNIMKGNILTSLACAALALGLSGSAYADINGSIGFTGTFIQTGGTIGLLNTADHMTLGSLQIATATGDLTGAGAPFSFASSIGVNGNPPSLVGHTLWTATVGAITYSFTIATESQTLTSGAQINLAGIGTMHDGNPGDDTAGEWQLGFGRSGASFTWQGTSASVGTPTTTPDGGATVVLLGAALSGLGLIRRKLA